MKKTITLTIGLLASGVMLASSGFFSPAQAQYYKGKTLEIIVGYASGGTDTAARIVSRRLQKYIPGNPSVIVKNMPGGGSLKAQNFIFERAAKDGLTIGHNPFQAIAEITKREGVRFTYPEFTFIAGVQGSGRIEVARTDVAPGGLKPSGDITKINKPLIYTGRNPLHGIDAMSTLAFELLGMNHTYIPGFRGAASITTSLQQNETNITGAGSIHWLTQLLPRMVDKGELVPLFQMGVGQPDGSFAPDPIYAGVPLFEDYYKKIKGTAPSGLDWEALEFIRNMTATTTHFVLGPPNMNPEAAEILRTAYAKSMADPETKAEGLKTSMVAYRHIGLEEGSRMLEKLKNADPKIIAYWNARVARMSGAK